MYNEDRLKKAIEYLIGYKVNDKDMRFMSYIYKTVVREILNNINHQELPKELEEVAEYRTIGFFIIENIDKLLSDDDLNIIKSIKEGDTMVEFEGESKADRLLSLSNNLINKGRRSVSCFRRLRW